MPFWKYLLMLLSDRFNVPAEAMKQNTPAPALFLAAGVNYVADSAAGRNLFQAAPLPWSPRIPLPTEDVLSRQMFVYLFILMLI